MSEYSSRKDTMPEDDKLKVAQAIDNAYTVEMFDLNIFIDDVNKVIRFSPLSAPIAPEVEE